MPPPWKESPDVPKGLLTRPQDPLPPGLALPCSPSELRNIINNMGFAYKPPKPQHPSSQELIKENSEVTDQVQRGAGVREVAEPARAGEGACSQPLGSLRFLGKLSRPQETEGHRGETLTPVCAPQRHAPLSATRAGQQPSSHVKVKGV